MRRKTALLAAGLLAGATLSVTGAAPAQAQDQCTAEDPTLAYVCRIVNTAPNPNDLVTYYYNLVWNVADYVYCTASPNC